MWQMILSLKLHQCFVLMVRKHFRAVFSGTLNGTGKTSLMTFLPMNCKHHGRKQWWKGKLKHNQILGDKHLEDCASPCQRGHKWPSPVSRD